MKLEIGKYYRSSDGRKVGPMRWRPSSGFNWDVNQFEHPLPDPLGRSLWDDNGVGDEGVHLVAEWKEETTMDKITMDSKYAYRKDPFTQVRILCVDRNIPERPVASMDGDGTIYSHEVYGKSNYYSHYDLVPLQVKLPDLWINLYDDGVTAVHKTKDSAIRGIINTYGEYFDGVKTIKYIPAPDQTS